MDRALFWLFVSLVAIVPTSAHAINVTPVSGSGDAATLAEELVDDSSAITLNSANFSIDLVGGGTVLSEIRGIASFSDGNAAGQLPPINQLDQQNPISYAGGIGVAAGVCLTTGVVTDADIDGANAEPGSGVGVQGPNNGFPLSAFFGAPPVPPAIPLNAGEISFRTDKPRDRDFANVKTVDSDDEGDATVLQFQINLSSPGFLRISFVFASDEQPFWIVTQGFDVNDSMAIFIRRDDVANSTFENIAVLKMPGQPDQPMSLRELGACGPLMFKNNQIAPAPDDDLIPDKQVFDFPTSLHGFDTNEDGFNRPNDGELYYNHEFGGFSKKLTRESPKPLSAGTHTIKIVVQDVFDRSVDSAVFLEAGSLKLFELAQGDYNRNGIVDTGDYSVWNHNYIHGTSPAYFSHGDGNGNGVVDEEDYEIWHDNYGATGNRDWSADFNRDGCVGTADFGILVGHYQGLLSCASRFEGDANGDGAVEDGDFGILVGQFQESCDGEALMAGGDEGDEKLNALLASFTDDKDLMDELRSKWKTAAEQTERTAVVVLAPIAKTLIPDKADANGDGRVDEADFAIIERALGIKE